MAVSNASISDSFSQLARLMDIHGENPFKIKSYAAAAFSIDRLTEELGDLPRENISAVRGIGASIGRQVVEILDSGELSQLRVLIGKTPPGVLEMLKIKGLGPKKISTVWKEMEIESIGELLYACNENRLLLYKGFGEKTQAQIADTINFYLSHQGRYLYAQLEGYLLMLLKTLREHFPGSRTEITGAFRRQLEIIEQPEWITEVSGDTLINFLEANAYAISEKSGDEFTATGKEAISLRFCCVSAGDFPRRLFASSGSPDFLAAWEVLAGATSVTAKSPGATAGAVPSGAASVPGTPGAGLEAPDAVIFSAAGLGYIPPALREHPGILDRARGVIPAAITASDIRGIIHSHSTWSDGTQSLEQMAIACIEQGFEYLVISDHSKSAFYANGLSEQRIREQHLQIDALNARLAPFHIFKSIECDILNDGSLDYSDEVLATFDLVIASIHSNLKMTPEKAMLRLLAAVRHPATRILGHPTGRLLLSRPGYPVDHTALIDACAAAGMVIELNAHPRRLDIDWRWIPYALEKKVMVSIDPDAHSVAGYHDVHYGVLAAQKGGVTAADNLSSFTREQMVAFVSRIKS